MINPFSGNMDFLRTGTVLIAYITFSVTNAIGQAKDSTWILTNEGCKIYNPHPVRNESIEWTGQCLHGFADGQGTLTWFKNGKQGDQYEGQMKRGSPNGFGRYRFTDGDVYEGLYVQGDLNGPGQLTKVNENKTIYYQYKGEFKADAANGYGQEIYFDFDGDTSSVYTGSFLDWKPHGQGLLKEYDDTKVTIKKGEFVKEKAHGKITLWEYRDDKLIVHFHGDFQHDQRMGYGIETTGIIKYDGEWKADKKSGKGKLFMDTLLIYEGDWEDGKFDGVGKRHYTDGSNYYGDFKSNYRDGLGKMVWKNGTRYIGQFKKDLFSGMGYVMEGSRVLHAGYWQNGVLTQPEKFATIKRFLEQKYNDRIQQLEAMVN